MAFDGDLEQYRQNLQDRSNSQKLAAFAKVEELFASKGENFGDDEATLMSEAPPQIPMFPFLIFGGAFIKDVLDAVLDFTIVGVIGACFFTVIFSIILGIWCYGKISGGFWKKMIIRRIFIYYGVSFVIELIPFIQIVPTTMAFVLLAHFHETKIAKLINGGLEYLHEAGWTGK